MLEMSINLLDKFDDFKQTDNSVRFGDSYIEKFASVHLGMGAWSDGDSAHIWVGEMRDPFPQQTTYDVIPEYSTHFDCEGLKIILSRKYDRISLHLIRTGTGSTPLYFHLRNMTFLGSWDFDFVAKSIQNPQINYSACQLYIDEGPSLSREQIFEEMYMLWPGEAVILDENGQTFTAQNEIGIAAPSFVKDDAMVCDAFLDIVADNLRSKIERSSGTLVEVSGGLDSSCIALASSKLSNNLNCYGLIHEGAIGEQQSRRRSEIVGLLSMTDFEYPSYAYPPIAALSLAESSLTPNDDNHRVSCGKGIDGHPSKNIDLLISGIGGDELFMRHSYKRLDTEVQGNISYSTAIATVARADMCLRRGIWPANPFASQSVVNFCRRLPDSFIEGRILEKMCLARAGLSDGYIFPRYFEHYGHVLSREASLLDFDRLFSESTLLQAGFGEVHRIVREAREKSADGFSSKDAYDLWKILKLDAVIQRYL